MRTQWNDEEDEALHGLPWIAQLAYLRALRPHMDYATGIVGRRRGISLKSICEVLHVEHGQGRRDYGDPSVKAVRHALELLERTGVIEKLEADRQLVFRLPLASRDDSVSEKWGRCGADVGQTKWGRDETSTGEGCGEMRGRRGAEGSPEKWGTPPESVDPEEGTNVPTSTAAPIDLTPATPERIPPCPHTEIIGLYHQRLPMLPRIVVSMWDGSSDAKRLSTIWRQKPRHREMEFWALFFETVRQNPWWTGDNDRGWRANLRWLVKPANFIKVVELMANNRIQQEARHG